MAHDGPDSRRAGRFGTANSRSPGQSSGIHSQQDSDLDSVLNDLPSARGTGMSRWMGWRLRLLVLCVLLGCLAVFALTRTLAGAPHLPASWRANAQAQVELLASSDPVLALHQGHMLVAMSGAGLTTFAVDALALHRSPRWVVEDTERMRQREMHEQLFIAQSQATVTLDFSDGRSVSVKPEPRGIANLSVIFWMLATFALVLYLVSCVVFLANPSSRNLLYAVMGVSQAANLLFIAIESTIELGLRAPFLQLDMPVRMAFDLVTAAAIVNAVCLHPRRLPGSGWIALAGWAAVPVLIGLFLADRLPYAWWWTQGGVAALGALAIGLLSWSYQIEPHPFAIMLRRFGTVTVSSWALLTLALGASSRLSGMPHNIADICSMVWYVFLGSLLLLIPFLARSQTFMREFALLAAVSTVATSLDLLFVAVFSLGQFASLTLSLFLSLAVYSGARQWILNHLLGSSIITTERMFEQLYRIAREVEVHPDRTPILLSQLLTELFEPLEVTVVERRSRRTRIAGDGSSMLVPLPALSDDPQVPHGSVMVRFAHRGRRLFSVEDARLTDRIVEQLRRAVRFDKAVEQGRSEERMRLAQDLHDDIGARLLTLMYKAQSPEMEEYLRHTLQDLKTLTRGLAASNHRLSHAAGEWKADLTQRLTAAHVELKWTFVFDEDITLTVVHWSALTRVMRELVSNVIAHAKAQQLEIHFSLDSDRIDLTVTDNGMGREPRNWSHGLGLGGVRKRVKQLGGEVEWREVRPHGISCRVVIRELSKRWQ